MLEREVHSLAAWRSQPASDSEPCRRRSQRQTQTSESEVWLGLVTCCLWRNLELCSSTF